MSDARAEADMADSKRSSCRESNCGRFCRIFNSGDGRFDANAFGYGDEHRRDSREKIRITAVEFHDRYNQSCPRVSLMIPPVFSISSIVCAVEMKAVSNCDGGK